MSAETLALASTVHCFHCGEANPPAATWRAVVDGEERAFCCAGCLAVAQTIRAAGLSAFYERRDAFAASLPRDRADEAFDAEAAEAVVTASDAGRSETALLIEGLRCGACVWLIETWLARQPGVCDAHVNLATRRARVRFVQERIGVAAILRSIAVIGYRAHPYDPARREAMVRKESRALLTRAAVALLAMMQVMMFAVPAYVTSDGVDAEYAALMNFASLVLTLPVVLYAAAPFFAGAWRSVTNRALGMDVPIALGVAAAFIASAWSTLRGEGHVYFDSVTMFVALVLCARWLELRVRERAGDVLETMARDAPLTAQRLRRFPDENGIETVSARALEPGDVVRVATGATVPADGTVVDGRSSVEEAILTGESRPCAKGAGDRVLAGSINRESPLVLRVDAVGEATALRGIARLAERAAAERPAAARLADRVARAFVAGLLVVAAAAACAWTFIEPARALPVAIAVLVVSCPCALSLATPAALAAAAGALARLRVLCVRPNALETLARVTHVVFDKTGTLTTGELKLVRIDAFAGDDARQLARAIALEHGSTHPIARALAAQVPAERVVAHDVVAIPGCGVEGTIGGARYRLGRPAWASPVALAPKRCAPGAGEIVVALADATRVLATLRFRDELRTDMPALIASLRNAGIGASIVSGDDPATVADVAGKVGIGEHRGAASPADKQAYIAALQARGEVVAMVGDGVNDAPGLARADVSIAFGNAATLAQWTADVVVPGADAQRIARALATARRAFRIVRENLAWALVYNAVAIPLAAIGWLTPLAAAAGMSASSLAVVLNAWRLRSARA
ncbi:MAG TPA: heavy metal translocating P-type ATPase [Casimicrobiaceae bacterium]|nr:heavy metal translocating P-type ATPase [Casimicrobiaceae bacterium]